jgi:hypothetical protein
MNYLPLSDNAARQAIDSMTTFVEFRRVQAQARSHAGAMYWKQEGDYEYLVKTRPRQRNQERLGPRSAATEKTFVEYTGRKRAVESRLASLREALNEAERMNKALKVGRAPSLLIGVLQALSDADLLEHFTVVGTHALYAYEAAAGVRIVPGALATQDIDLLWDARRRVQFMTDLEQVDSSMLGVLKKADPTFERKEGQNETAINARGFEVECLRSAEVPVVPCFEHAVVSMTGRMAWMSTVSPSNFIEEAKRRRDRLQADVVQELLDQGLLLP